MKSTFKKLTAIVLGGTIPHVELIKNLQSRGYYVILIDYLTNPPAAEVADLHLIESTLDKDRVLEIANFKKADLVICACIDQAIVTACYVSEKLGLPAPYSYETALSVTNKALMKATMVNHQIPTAKHRTVNNLDEIVSLNFQFPLVVKPADSNSSKGVRKADNISELMKFAEEAIAISRTGEIIVEEFIIGDEIGVDSYIDSDGEVYLLMLHKKRKPMVSNEDVLFSIGSISPPEISVLAKKKIKELIKTISKIYDLKNTPFLIQTIVNNDEVSVIEFSPRIGGGLNAIKIKKYCNFDLIEAAVNSYLNNNFVVKFNELSIVVTENHLYSIEGTYEKVINLNELLNEKLIDLFRYNKKSGSSLMNDFSSSNRVGSFFVSDNSIQGLSDKLDTIYNKLEIVVDGKQYKLSPMYNTKDL